MKKVGTKLFWKCGLRISKKILNLAINWPWKKKVIYNFLSFFGHFCGLVSYIFTIFFMGSEVCLERCDSYGNFGYLEKNQTFLFHENFVKEHSVLLSKSWLCSSSKFFFFFKWWKKGICRGEKVLWLTDTPEPLLLRFHASWNSRYNFLLVNSGILYIIWATLLCKHMPG